MLLRLIVALVMTAALPAAGDPPAAHHQLARDILKQLVEIKTTQSAGDTYQAAQAMAARLVAAGLPTADVRALQSAPKRGNLVARLRGTGKRRPMLLVAHLDVVEAKREDWTTDPFKLVEQDGYLYARGVGDDKAMAASWVAMLIRMKREGYRPDRDLILVLETDEEISDANGRGISWLLANHRELIDGEFALNEGANVATRDGKPLWNGIQTAEKIFQSYWLEIKNPGGHSSQPRADNAIYQLANALVRLEKFAFPVQLNETTRRFVEKMVTIESGQMAADLKSVLAGKPDPAALARLSAIPPYNAQLRTTCVATRLEAGHADNALPQVAKAMVNCRAVPGHSIEDLTRTLRDVLAEPKLAITPVKRDTASGASPIDKDLFTAVERLTAKYWPGVPVVPVMSTGATDGRFLRNAGIPTFGHSGLAADILDVRAHGKDERIAISAFLTQQDYLYDLVKLLATTSAK